MLYDLAENKLVVDWLQGWNGFRVGLVIGAIIVAVWLPLVFTASQVGKGDLYDLSMTVQIPSLASSSPASSGVCCFATPAG